MSLQAENIGMGVLNKVQKNSAHFPGSQQTLFIMLSVMLVVDLLFPVLPAPSLIISLHTFF